MRKVKLPEVTEEKAEATFMVLFATPLKRLGLVNIHKHKHTHRQTRVTKRALRTQSRGKLRRAPLFWGECYQCVYGCMHVFESSTERK